MPARKRKPVARKAKPRKPRSRPAPQKAAGIGRDQQTTDFGIPVSLRKRREEHNAATPTQAERVERVNAQPLRDPIDLALLGADPFAEHRIDMAVADAGWWRAHGRELAVAMLGLASIAVPIAVVWWWPR